MSATRFRERHGRERHATADRLGVGAMSATCASVEVALDLQPQPVHPKGTVRWLSVTRSAR
jgi:hypothetical protein